MVFSKRESNTTYEALRISDLAYCRDLEREVKYRWTILVKVYTLGWNMHVGNESLVVVGVRWHLWEESFQIFLCCFPCNLSLA